MRTYQSRPLLDSESIAALNAYGERFGCALRTLHARRCAGTAVRKPAFMREFDLTARQFNAVRVSLDGIEAGIRERRPELIVDLERRIASATRKQRKTDSPFVAHQVARRIARLKDRLQRLNADRQAGMARICFGSKRLFRAQRALQANGYADHVAWRSAWQHARSSQFLVLGSKDETGGCQGCVAVHQGAGVFGLRLRLPNRASEKYVVFAVRFAYGWERLVRALDLGQAISYRFLRDEKGWRVFASSAVEASSYISDLGCGALGVDLNADHVAACVMKHDGNPVETFRLPLVTYGASSDRAEALIGECVKSLVQRAVSLRVPIVLERLEFSKKKALLRAERGARYARMLSSFSYVCFRQMLCARAQDAGIEVIFVNPAYSSLIGRHKFAPRYEISTHAAAALVLARRAKRFSERPGRRLQLTLGVSARKHARHVWSFWSALARRTAMVAPSGASPPGDSRVYPGRFRRRLRGDSSSDAGGIPARQSAAKTVRAA